MSVFGGGSGPFDDRDEGALLTDRFERAGGQRVLTMRHGAQDTINDAGQQIIADSLP